MIHFFRLGSVAILIVALNFGCSLNQPDSEVDKAMRAFAAGKFESDKDIKPVSGWTMTTVHGQEIPRSLLQHNAEKVIALGPHACEDLLEWIEHDQMEIRYIASFAIQEIVGEKLGFPNFAELEEVKANKWQEKFRKKVRENPGQK